MCGICGYQGIKSTNLIKDMLNSLVHRGPDDYGIYSDKNITLGHRRLSIIDLNNGKQPIYNEDKSILISFNGEIYNYKELKKDLQKKNHIFSTNTDTEVIVHAYEEYGVGCLSKFNGMFAFAIWDKKKKELLLARDRFGTKPLYYYFKNDIFIFASEVKAILEYDQLVIDYNPQAIVDYFTYHYISGEKTYFKDILLLKPGHYLTIANGKLKQGKFWELHHAPQKKPEMVQEFKDIFERTITRQLISDVEVGSTLSGGFDASSIALSASKKVDKKMSLFTIKFNEGGKYDETALTDKIANLMDANLHRKIIEGSSFINESKKIIYHLDVPGNGTPIFSQYLLSRLISKQVKVVLSGVGGDELMGGYHVFKSFNFLDKLSKNPLHIFALIRLFKSHEFFRGMYFVGFPFLDKEVRKTGLFVVFNKAERKKLFTSGFYNSVKHYNPSNFDEIPKHSSFVERALHVYLKIFLPTGVLLQDKVSMAHSLESRVPFCDNEILDFSLSLSMDDKLKNNELKYILKESMREVLPAEVYNQPKKGFPTPFSIWFRKDLRNYVYAILLDKKTVERGIFNPRYVRKLLDKYTRQKKDGSLSLIGANKIWSLLMTELWFRVFIDGEKDLLKEQNMARFSNQIIN